MQTMFFTEREDSGKKRSVPQLPGVDNCEVGQICGKSLLGRSKRNNRPQTREGG